MLNYLFENPLLFLMLLVALILSIGIHEFMHAFTAYKLGDSTPKLQGRVTLNPFAHIDPLGLLAVVLIGFGWGRPVEYDIYNLRNPKRDVLLISFAGPLSNLVLAFLCFVFFNFIWESEFLQILMGLNLVLFVFNLIPVFPLDGFNVVRGLLPYGLAYQWGELERFGIFILIFMLIFNIPSLLMDRIVPVILTIFNLLI
jgi:Zn-dependent protease